ncbi:MAG: aldehyde dehydrogenase family protein [Methanoregulaceae archaeon]|nr:aldehyde dehydrogenase family protein [Methanoregulaceae archaeon]
MAEVPNKITYVTLADDEKVHPAYEIALKRIQGEFGHHYGLYTGGAKTGGKPEFPVYSPIDGETLIGSFQAGDSEDTGNAINAAKRAFPVWSRTSWEERTRIIRSSADFLESRAFDLAALLTWEVGKTRTEALAEIFETLDLLRYYCEVYERAGGYYLPMPSPVTGEHCVSLMKPYGVWAVISPFNFPVALAAGMCTGALLTGNTVVFKPTSEAPLSGIKLYEAFISGGVPGGALNIVTGPGGPFGKNIVSHPDIDGIAFTGSKNAGMWLLREFVQGQRYPKPLVLEMGSKNAVIVSAKADLTKAVEGVVRSAFGFGGQKCSATSRVYVQEPVAAEFMEELKQRAGSVKVGDPRERETFFGPLIDRKARETFIAAVRQVIAEGGTIETGGEVLTGAPYGKGHYVAPTVVTGIPHDHPLCKNELFVPFLIVTTCRSLQEAVEYVNNTDFGLTAGIFSEDSGELDFFFSHVRSGVTYANRAGGATTGAWPGSQSFTGWNASGSTGRGSGGPYYLLSFLREQAQTRVS